MAPARTGPALSHTEGVTFDWISFTTDYGLSDGFVAACHGVIARIVPQVRVLDVTHLVPPQDVRHGALVLAQVVPYLPPAVHLAVVDPGVGTARRGIALTTAAGALVGPDNGLLLPAAQALGGIVAAHELQAAEYRLSQVTRTFHGRDVFAPAAAHLAGGLDIAALGSEIDPDLLARLPSPRVVAQPGRVETEVLTVDHFGNLQLGGTLAQLGAEPGETVHIKLSGKDETATVGATFADVPQGRPVLFADSAGQLALAINGGSAAASFAARPGVPVVLSLPTGTP